jgi:hypothetical protein
MTNQVLHRQLAAGVFHCGAKAADGARGTPNPANVTCGMCQRAVEARQQKAKTSLRLLTEIRDRLTDTLARRGRGSPR